MPDPLRYRPPRRFAGTARPTGLSGGSGAGSEPEPCGLRVRGNAVPHRLCGTGLFAVSLIQHDRRDLHVYGKPVMDSAHHRAVPRGPRHRGFRQEPVPRGPRHRKIPGDGRSAPCRWLERLRANRRRHAATVCLGFNPCQGAKFSGFESLVDTSGQECSQGDLVGETRRAASRPSVLRRVRIRDQAASEDPSN